MAGNKRELLAGDSQRYGMAIIAMPFRFTIISNTDSNVDAETLLRLTFYSVSWHYFRMTDNEDIIYR
jgi:hypothetical protein